MNKFVLFLSLLCAAFLTESCLSKEQPENREDDGIKPEFYLANIAGHLNDFDTAVFNDDEHLLLISHYDDRKIRQFFVINEKDTLSVAFAEDGFPALMCLGRNTVMFGGFSDHSAHVAVFSDNGEYEFFNVEVEQDLKEYKSLLESTASRATTMGKEYELLQSTLVDEFISELLELLSTVPGFSSGVPGNSIASAELYLATAIAYLISDNPVYWEVVNQASGLGSSSLLFMQVGKILGMTPTTMLVIADIALIAYDSYLIWDGIKNGKFGSIYEEVYELFQKEIAGGVWLASPSGKFAWPEQTGIVPLITGISNFDISQFEWELKDDTPLWLEIKTFNLGPGRIYFSYKLDENNTSTERHATVRFQTINVANIDYELTFDFTQRTQVIATPSEVRLIDLSPVSVIIDSPCDESWEVDTYSDWLDVKKTPAVATQRLREVVITPKSLDHTTGYVKLKVNSLLGGTYNVIIPVFINGEDNELRQKLIQFYNDTDGPHWIKNDNWCSDKPLEEWYGIFPDVYDHDSVQINLESNGLTGDGSLAGCELITYLNVWDNQLTTLDVSGCSSIRIMYCMDNQLTSLDVSNCSSMTTLGCSRNQLESLNVSGCSSLTGLSCENNKLTHLDISECSSLLHLYCGANLFTSLDFSWHPTLQKLDCSASSRLTSLNMSGSSSLVELDCGSFNSWELETIPTPLTSLNVTNCSNLTSLICNGGKLNSLNLSGCYALKELWCGNNYLQSLDISDCKSLYVIDCARNQLSSISLSGYTELKTLYICYNSFTNLSLRGCTSLEHLECYNNDLHSLDLSGCISLTSLSCDNNHLSSLDLSDSSNIEHVFADNNNLVSIILPNRKHLKYLWCRDNNLTDLNLSNSPLLTNLQIIGNLQMKSLAINGCSSLKELECFGLGLQYLGVTNCSSLESLVCGYNQLTSLDTEGCVSLLSLECQQNAITQQVPELFKQLETFNHDKRYSYYYDENGNLTYKVNEVGWYYPGEPGKGYHGW